ncbi:MAG: Serine/threonine-protein kinase PknD [Verrucomicrobia subdivision 3 bacterium]|nr:Serine/threonine-protein kinase PknD [Limisphaerales bacterium]MCS1417382.1 Serine/threonine-protein kinase PknD [Limisphaerales bacterium]
MAGGFAVNLALIQNTLWVGVGSVGLAVAAGVAVFLASLVLPSRMARVLPVMAGINLLLPHFLVIAVWLDLLGNAGLIGWASGVLYSIPGACGVLALLSWPIPYFFVFVRRGGVIRSIEALDPFVSGGCMLRLAIWPQLKRPLMWSSLLVFGLSINNLAIPGILQVRVIAEEIFVRFNTELDMWTAAKLGMPVLVGSAALAYFVFGREFGVSWRERSFSPRSVRQRFGRWMSLGFVIAAFGVVSLGLVLPLVSLLVAGESWRDLRGAFVVSQQAIFYSVLFAALTASWVTFLGVFLRSVVGARCFWWLFLIPGTLLGAALAMVCNRLLGAWFELGWMPLMAALVIRYLGLGISGGLIAVNGADWRLAAMARLEGFGVWDRFWHCVWPSAGKPLLCLWWMVYLLCLWEVEVLIFMVPPGVETLALRVFNLLHYGHNSQVNASCLILIGLGLMPLVGWWIWRVAVVYGIGRIRNVAASMVLGLLGVGCGLIPNAASQLESCFFSTVEAVGQKGTGVGQFNKPRSVVVGPSDDVFAVDMTGRVQRFDRSGRYLGFWQMPETERGRPKGMALDGEGNIIVIEPHYARVNHFTPEGELVSQWGRRGVKPGEIAFPRAVACHSSGDLFLTEFQQVERVQRFRSDGTYLMLSFGQLGDEAGAFNRAEGIGIDQQDRLFVADSCNHRVQVFDDTGQLIGKYGKPGSGPGELSYPYDVKIDVEGNQYVCEFGNSRIQVFDPDFQSVEIIGGPGPALGQFSNPWSMDLDSEGNLWVADSGNHRIQKLVRKLEDQ